MIRLIAADWMKMRHRWMPRILLIIEVIVLGILILGFRTSPRSSDLALPQGFLLTMAFAGFLAQFLLPIIAGAWAGNEYSWGTLRMVLSRRPNRSQVIASGLVIILLFTVAVLVVALLAGAVGGLVGGSAKHQSGSIFPLGLTKVFLAEIVSMMFYALMAFAAGTIFQSPAAGIGIGIGFSIAESIVGAIFRGLGNPWQSFAEHFPYQYATSLPQGVISPYFSDGFLGGTSGSPGVVSSLIGVLVYSAIVIAAMLFIVNNRDVTA